MISRLLAGTILGLGLAAGPYVESARAQTDSTARDTVKAAQSLGRPVLGGHRFIPNPFAEDPFPRTFVRSSLGMGKAMDLDVVPEFVIGTDTISGITGELLFALLDFQYSQRIKEWMGFWVTAKLRGRLGTDAGAILTQGVTVSTVFDIGWLFKFLETDRVAMSAIARVTKGSFTGINLAEFLRGVVEDQPVPLVRDVPTLWTGAGLRFAWGATTWLGVTANGDLMYGESPDRTRAGAVAGKLSVGTSLDFASLIHVPIGLVLGFELFSDDPNGETSNNSSGLLARIAYTGRDDVSISLDLTGQHTTLFSGTTVNVGAARISMRYYF